MRRVVRDEMPDIDGQFVMCAGAAPVPRKELSTFAFAPTCLRHWACLSRFSLDPLGR